MINIDNSLFLKFTIHKSTCQLGLFADITLKISYIKISYIYRIIMKTLIRVQALFWLLFVSSCDFKEDIDTPNWHVSGSVPLATSSFGFDELLGDTIMSLDTLGDKSLVFVYQQDLVDYNFNDLIEPASVSIQRTDNLGNVDINDVSLHESLTFEDVVGNIFADGTFVPAGTPPFNQSTNSFIDGVQLDYDASSSFQEILFANGMVEINIFNGFPFTLTNLSLLLKSTNSLGQSSIVEIISVDEILPNQSITEEINMQGKKLSSSIEVVILNADLPAVQTDFTVDYFAEFEVSILIKDIEIQNAIVEVPYKELVNKDSIIDFDFGHASLNRMLLEDGELSMSISNNINTSIHLEISVPGASVDGVPLQILREIPASDDLDELISLVGYELDLGGLDGFQSNQLIVQTKVWVDSTNVPIQVDILDEVSTTITVDNMTPSVAWGFLGQDTIVESQEVDFLNLSTFNGDLDFEFVDVKLITENYVGASAELKVQRFESFSESSSIELKSSLLSEPFDIVPAQESSNPKMPIIASSTEIVFDETNSNIDKIIESKPNQLAFDLELILNAQNPFQNDGFFYTNYGVHSELQVEIPVSFNVSDLLLQDTAEVSLSVPEKAIDGSFSVVVENSFPFEAGIKLQLLNRGNLVLQELTSTDRVLASDLNSVGETIRPTQSVLEYPFENLNVILNRTKKIALEITINTPENAEFVKLYSNNTIELTIIGNFKNHLFDYP